MNRIKWNRVVILALCMGVSYFWAAANRASNRGMMKAVDFGDLYFSTICIFQHVDPYNPRACNWDFGAAAGDAPQIVHQQGNPLRYRGITEIYPPTIFLMVAPFAKLPWPVAVEVWVGFIACLMILGGYLAWDLASDAPAMAGCMSGFMLLNCVVLLTAGNPVGIVVPLCMIAAWCFVKDRVALSGAALLAISLVVKPHDVGLVWVYFLLAGGTGRRRVLQTLAMAAVLLICAAVWVAPVSPRWIGEIGSNATAFSAKGGATDPGPAAMDERGYSPLIPLQNSLSVFKDDPHFYNPVSYLVVGCLILIWGVATLRKQPTRERMLLGLAVISILTMLPVYHRAEDAKLLLLAIPACAMLWAEKGARRWIALSLTAAAIFVTSDIPIIAIVSVTYKLPVSTTTLAGKLALLALQPAPLVLLAAGCFYLWVYVRYRPPVPGNSLQQAVTEPRAAHV